jgi:hypothetical protein
MRTISGILLILLLLSTPALGRSIFVDNMAGDDLATGGQARATTAGADGPVRTITRALQLAQSGDAIVLANNSTPYRESISLVGSRRSGLPEEPFTIRGNGAVLDGSLPVPPDEWRPYEGPVFCFRPRPCGYQQLFLDGRPAARVAVAPGAKRPPAIRPLQWCLLRGVIYFCVEQTKLPADYNLACSYHQAGITLFHVDHVVIVDLTVQGFQLDGINAFNSARQISLGGVNCRNNGRSGIAVGGASSVEIQASLLEGNGLAQLLTLPCSETQVQQTQMPSATAPAWLSRGGQLEIDGKLVAPERRP